MITDEILVNEFACDLLIFPLSAQVDKGIF